ncbi:hypothetical protein KDW99_12510 [Marinomonas rhizomae]|uniref:hypothetical protein n=1 Tax=Marinomonas rhizomae TaxID=491948 RepID=UPI0021047369|nr:hypothetical protein [Marinomonas rhizomae]UTV98097.1 hypothetical protein KDW99_12510 [Marinomonas rhizomae]
MKNFKTILGFSLVFLTFNIYATSSVDKNTNKGNTVSKSCIVTESETDKKEADLFVRMDSFRSYDGGFNEKMNQVSAKDKMLYAFTSVGIIAVELQTAFTPMLLGFCNKEIAIDNKCNYETWGSDGSQIIIETKWKNATQYTMTQSVRAAEGTAKRKKMTISTELPNYWNGTMTLYGDDGSRSETSWSRSADGTEHYHSESVGSTENSSATFTEYPSCSADMIYIKNDVKITANWSLTGKKTTGKFTYCNEKGCHAGEW